LEHRHPASGERKVMLHYVSHSFANSANEWGTRFGGTLAARRPLFPDIEPATALCSVVNVSLTLAQQIADML